VSGTPDRTAHARGEQLRLAPPGLTCVDPRARLYALPERGILVIRNAEKTTIARTLEQLASDGQAGAVGAKSCGCLEVVLVIG
jgi:hypothetical protein